MNRRADLLIKTLSDGGSRHYYQHETEKLVEISYLEGINDVKNLERKIYEFKCNYVDSIDWLDINCEQLIENVGDYELKDPTPMLLQRLLKLEKMVDAHFDVTSCIEGALMKFESGALDIDESKACRKESNSFIEELDLQLSRFEAVNNINSHNLSLLNRLI